MRGTSASRSRWRWSSRRRGRWPALTFLINGDGAARRALEEQAAGLRNVRFSGYQPIERLPEVLATGDIHLVPLEVGTRHGERAVEDVLDPRRRPPGAGGDRSRHRGSAHHRRGAAQASACRPTIRSAFRTRAAAADRRPDRSKRDGCPRPAMGRSGRLAGCGRQVYAELDRRVERPSSNRPALTPF